MTTHRSPAGGEDARAQPSHPVILITSNPSLVGPFLRDTGAHGRLGIQIPRAVFVTPSMRLLDRARDLHRTLRRRARILRSSLPAQALHHFASRRLWRDATAPSAKADCLDVLRAGRELLVVPTANDPRLIDLLRKGPARIGLVVGSDVLSRHTLDAIDVPLFNVHLGDPCIVRGQPPVFWEIYGGHETVRPTLHRLTAVLDGGTVIHQREIPIAWRPTLDETLAVTRDHLARELPALLEQGLRLILEGTTSGVELPPGPLRTTPTLGQVRLARTMCRRRAERFPERRPARPETTTP